MEVGIMVLLDQINVWVEAGLLNATNGLTLRKCQA